MINHPLTVLPRTPPPFAKLGLIRPNPPVHFFFPLLSSRRRGCGELTICQVEWRWQRLQQPVLIRYQISEVSQSRRPGAALLLLRHVASVSCEPPLGRPGVAPGRRLTLPTRHLTCLSAARWASASRWRTQTAAATAVCEKSSAFLFVPQFVFSVTQILIETPQGEELLPFAASAATRWHLWHCLKEPVS